jgi:AcrR family transcriptional regulator
MPRDAHKTRMRILDAAYGQFRRRGYSRVSMDEIASATRVTKRTLYYHFKSKDALLTAVLEAQHQLALDAFRTFGDHLSGSVETIIDGLFRELAVWADRPRWAGSGFTRLVIELADLLIARRHKSMLEGHLAAVLKKAGIAEPHDMAPPMAPAAVRAPV